MLQILTQIAESVLKKKCDIRNCNKIYRKLLHFEKDGSIEDEKVNSSKINSRKKFYEQSHTIFIFINFLEMKEKKKCSSVQSTVYENLLSFI